MANSNKLPVSLFVGFIFARHSWINAPFFIAGGQILYDLLLYKEFLAIRPPEELAARSS
jgi:hypothetical protein